MPHTTMRQHRTIRKGTWQPTSCAMTITNPVGQQLTPTHHRHSTRGSKREWNLHTEGCSSPYNPPICRRQIRGIRNRRTDRHTRNHQTITRNLRTTPPSKRLSLYHPPPPHQPRANTTIPLHLTTPHLHRHQPLCHQYKLAPVLPMHSTDPTHRTCEHSYSNSKSHSTLTPRTSPQSQPRYSSQ